MQGIKKVIPAVVIELTIIAMPKFSAAGPVTNPEREI